MQHLHFVGLNPKDFIDDLKQSLIPELKKQLAEEFQPKKPVEYLSRTETAKLLKVDLSTLHRWTKTNLLTAYGLGNRVYYKRSEIDKYLDNNKLL
ncbi:helix-turn-helix domain-containing protein [Empedobacter brevis]|uniref:helix-turn-helix domain-containing protein n=1 Tax=Empedobacter brevis TaxID=247 RepID=UPI00289BE1DD|nr:helix-turn-helix domain-containing protein [Empedobacter brevis]